jgi:hypothetical protein
MYHHYGQIHLDCGMLSLQCYPNVLAIEISVHDGSRGVFSSPEYLDEGVSTEEMEEMEDRTSANAGWSVGYKESRLTGLRRGALVKRTRSSDPRLS